MLLLILSEEFSLTKLQYDNLPEYEIIYCKFEDLSNYQGQESVIIVNVNFIENLSKIVNTSYVKIIAFGEDYSIGAKAISSGALEFVSLKSIKEDPHTIISILKCLYYSRTSFETVSPQMSQIIQLANQVAKSQANLLITGETGVGKEVLTKYIHANSTRASKKMVSINCAAIPENLVESELFGHVKGSFTGAVSNKEGKFLLANDSTLFLDEITETSLELQAKLLRAIQEKEISPIGQNFPITVNTRIVATSNRNLEYEVSQGKFREDLLFRLNVIEIHIPPLRERKEDIENLARFFVAKYCKINDIPYKTIDSSILKEYMNYDWPGNIRELENTIHRAVILSPKSKIEESFLSHHNVSANFHNVDNTGFSPQTISSMEKDLILKTVDHCYGNRTQAANLLGISVKTLRTKLKNWAME